MLFLLLLYLLYTFLKTLNTKGYHKAERLCYVATDNTVNVQKKEEEMNYSFFLSKIKSLHLQFN